MKLAIIFYLLAFDLFALTFGVVPQQNSTHLIKVWMPIVKYLQKATGEEITLKLKYSIPSFEEDIYAGKYDIAYMNPYHYIIAHKKQNYIAKIRADKNIVGILVVNKKSGINNMVMLKNKTFLFPAPYAFAATLLTKYELLKNFGIKIDKLKYVNSHDSVYKGIARGIGDVGGGIERTLKNLQDVKTKDSLKILYKTKAYPSHPIAFSPKVSIALREKITKALLDTPKNLLKALSIKSMIRVEDKEYDVVRDIANQLKLE